MSQSKKSVNLSLNNDYKAWLKDLKQKVLNTQLKAAVQVNSTLLVFYWELGESIVQRQTEARWGDGFLKQLSKDLMAEFPEIKGFSRRNLELIRQWYQFWSDDEAITQQAVAQLVQIPWGHNLTISRKCQTETEALYYIRNTIEHGWSRNVLTHQIESGLWQREGNAVSNFIKMPTSTYPAATPALDIVISVLSTVISALSTVIPALSTVIPALSTVIPAKAGIHKGFVNV